MRHFWPEFGQWLNCLPDTRFQPYVIYDRRFLAWVGILLFALKLGSRRQIDYELRALDTCVLSNLNRLAGTQQESLPVHGTLDHFIGHVGAEPFGELPPLMVRRLLRMKVAESWRVQGRYVVGIDGTGYLRFHDYHCDQCIVQEHGSKKVYLHPVFEAKLLGPCGVALSVATEFILNDPYYAPSKDLKGKEALKQDCELKALARLAPQLKRSFPQLKICLSGDSLFGCGTAIQIARDNEWDFIYTFKPGRTPALWEEFEKLLELAPENELRLTLRNGVEQVYRWVNDLPYEDSKGRQHIFHALKCEETVDGETTTFAWVTSMPVREENAASIASAGRMRSRIEEGFNVQKNSELRMEHAYGTDPEAIKAYYYQMQIAHIMLQLFEKGSLLRAVAEQHGKSTIRHFGSLKNIARRLLECFRNLRLPDETFEVAHASRIQIRLAPT